MGTAIKHPVPDQVKPSFVMFDIRALWRSARLNPVWHMMLYSCTRMATVSVKKFWHFSYRESTAASGVLCNIAAGVGEWVDSSGQQPVTTCPASAVDRHSRDNDVSTDQWQQRCCQQQRNDTLGDKSTDVGIAACTAQFLNHQSTKEQSVTFCH